MFQTKRNVDIWEQKGSIPFWIIAEKIGVHENTVRNWMKTNLSQDKKEKILTAIKEIKSQFLVSSDY
ncbi:hypothetical protein [Metabacillus litoralis]|uniref:hypothetical protein n=1 Tax=Metabacillus litoralis TaxID=152268 RepID=UPI00203D2C3C|nr:hypothetical protein [Metabacillus litoralis]MCM3165115.1 hypothetical protein [Metabacillus litoralis]